MREFVVAIGMALVAVPSAAQITKPAGGSSADRFFDSTNRCLSDFDTKAKSKKLSVDTYKAALDGACVEELRDLRALYMLSMERNPNQSYHMERFDANVRDTRAKMVASYAMR